MALPRVLRRHAVRLGWLRPADGLFPPQEMQRVLLREQARTDRTGDSFALLVFSAANRQQRATLDEVAKILRGRIRLTDEAGWLDGQSIGVVLPSTPPQGAWTLADDVCLQLRADRELPACSVYVYPAPRPTDSRRAAGQGRPVESAPLSAIEALLIRPLPLWKRSLDVLGALLGLILLTPVLLTTALLIKLTSRGPVLFRQWRSGRAGKPFVCLKFRTMVVDAEQRQRELMRFNEQDGPAFKIRHDPRVTLVGRFLRTTSIDEMPQLWNVLRGDMSLVGPRPLPCHEAEACRGWLRRRMDATPGLTCIWQIHGRSSVSFAEWVRMDVRYIRSQSLWYDLKLIIQTLPAVVLRRGV